MGIAAMMYQSAPHWMLCFVWWDLERFYYLQKYNIKSKLEKKEDSLKSTEPVLAVPNMRNTCPGSRQPRTTLLLML